MQIVIMGGEADNNGVVWCSDILDSTYADDW